MTGPEFISFLKEFFPLLSPSQEEKFLMMDSLYRDWNSKINVISRKDIDNLYSHHILHSLAIARYLQLDLGCGGGFPGIPLAVMFPDAHFTLCDSVGKKTIVASGVSESLGLENVEVVNARAESLGRQFDFVVSRAVASLQDFYPWIKGRYKQHVLYLKGGDVNEEIAEMMGRFRMKKGSVSTWPVDSWLSEEYFKGKLIVDII